MIADERLNVPMFAAARKALTLLSVVALAWLPAASWAAEAETEVPPEAETASGNGDGGPVEMVRETSDEVLALIEQARGYAEENPEQFYREVEALLSPVVDFDSFARSVMAVHYRKATPEQRERFAQTFKWGLVRTYALALTEFENGEVVVVPPDRPPRNPDRQTVKMEIRTESGDVYPVLYSLAKDDGGWQVRNLIVNGVNMGLTYRNQFNSAMNDPRYGGDLDKVIDDWGELLEEEGTIVDEVKEAGPAAEGQAS